MAFRLFKFKKSIFIWSIYWLTHLEVIQRKKTTFARCQSNHFCQLCYALPWFKENSDKLRKLRNKLRKCKISRYENVGICDFWEIDKMPSGQWNNTIHCLSGITFFFLFASCQLTCGVYSQPRTSMLVNHRGPPSVALSRSESPSLLPLPSSSLLSDGRSTSTAGGSSCNRYAGPQPVRPLLKPGFSVIAAPW